MSQQQPHIDELLAKWLAGEASQLELNALNEWAEESPDNKLYAEQFEKLWDNTVETSSDAGIDIAWEKIKSKTIEKKPRIGIFRIGYIAIGVAAASLALFILFRGNNPMGGEIPQVPLSYETGVFIQSGESEYTAVLPDLTRVTLEPNSSIWADTGFGKSNRAVVLKGAANFRTEHGQRHVFTVHSQKTEIRDIGTEFYVDTRQKNVLVKVSEGKVQIKTAVDSVFMVQGDSAIVNELLEKIEIFVPEKIENEHSTKRKTISFNRTALKKVTETLNYLYSSDVRIASTEIKDCQFTSSFEDESLENILEIIRDTFNLEIKREGSIIYFYGKGCN